MISRILVFGAAATLVAAPLTSPALAQTPTPPAPTATAPQTAAGTRQTIAVRSLIRRYTVGDTRATEFATPVSYDLTSGRVHVALDASALRFSAAGTTVRGASPLSGRVDFRVHEGDSIRIYGATASSPATLSDGQTNALGSVGTSTLDFDSYDFGTPARAGARIVLSNAIGSLTASLRGAAEYEPRPGGAQPVYWQGSTLRGGVSLSGFADETRLAMAVDVSHSRADSLGGRNLFPGGGLFSLSATADGPIGELTALGFASAYYGRPFGQTRTDQPNRLTPIGDVFGLSGSVTFPLGSALLSPALDLTREASHAMVPAGALTTVPARMAGHGWAANASLAALLSPTRWLDVTPEVGFVAGAVGVDYSTTVVRRRRAVTSTQSFTDGIRGWWVALELSASY